MTDVLSRTDIIVRAIVGDHRGYLSDDLMGVFTDYELKNPQILYQSQPPRESKRSIPPSMTITLPGGEVMVGAVRYTQYEEALPILQPGIETVFLVQRRNNRYELVEVFLGAFAIRDNQLFPLTRKAGFAEEYKGVSASDAIPALVAQVRALRGQR